MEYTPAAKILATPMPLMKEEIGLVGDLAYLKGYGLEIYITTTSEDVCVKAVDRQKHGRNPLSIERVE